MGEMKTFKSAKLLWRKVKFEVCKSLSLAIVSNLRTSVMSVADFLLNPGCTIFGTIFLCYLVLWSSLPQYLVPNLVMVSSSVLGFPRIGTRLCYRYLSVWTDESFIGANREVKKAVEAYWAGKLSVDELTKAVSDVKKWNWNSIKEKGVDYIPR